MATETAKKIRQALKEQGITARQVGVKTRNYSAIYCTIKDLVITKETIENIAREHESISRCEYTNEILEGGNTFVFVDYDHDSLRQEAQKHIAKAEEIEQKYGNSKDGIILASNDNTELIYFSPYAGYHIAELRLRIGNKVKKYSAYNKHAIAEALALFTAQHGELVV